jgi:NarL family two-component system response regulator LiaR
MTERRPDGGDRAGEASARARVRVLIAHRDHLTRRRHHRALGQQGLCVVGQAADTAQAVSLATRCAPDVTLIDADLPPEGGLRALERLQAAAPDTRIILLARSEDEEIGLLALSRGAAGCVSPDIAVRSLARVVRGVMTGEAAISRLMAGRLRERLRQLSEGLSGMRPVKSPLTTREWEVLELLKAGATTPQIAKELVVSYDTVHSHVQHILRKLHAHSRTEAVAIAERSRLERST